jgi:hypothetical protein
MSLLVAAPGILSAAASDLANLGTTIETAVAAAAAPTTGVLAPAADEVSAQIATLFGAHGQLYQTLGARAAAFHDQFVQALGAGAASYTAAEVANVAPLQAVEQAVQGAVSAPAQTMLGSLTTDFASLTGGVAGAASLNLASLPGPIGQWGNVITGAWANLQQIGMEIQTDPLPVLAQVVHNQIGFANQAGSDLAQIWTGVQPFVQQQLPQDLQTLFSSILAGNISAPVAHFEADLLLGLLPTLNPIDQLLTIPGQMSQNYTNVLSANLPGIGLDLLLSPLGPAFGSTQAVADTMQSVVDAWNAGQPLAAFADLLNVPAAGTGAFLNGYQTQFDIGFTGLLSPANSPFGPGLLDNLLVQFPQQIATTLANGGPTATWAENFSDLSSMFSSGLGSL